MEKSLTMQICNYQTFSRSLLYTKQNVTENKHFEYYYCNWIQLKAEAPPSVDELSCTRLYF